MFAFVIICSLFTVCNFANAAEGARKPASIKSTTWETREIPMGKACPFQAQRYDEIAYQLNGDGGYVCFMCDYTEQSPFLVVTEQSKCSTTIKCKNGKCQ